MIAASAAKRASRIYVSAKDADIGALEALVARAVDVADYPNAKAATNNVLIYDCGDLRRAIVREGKKREIMAEFVDALATGPGVVVLKSAETDMAVIDRASELFGAMIGEQNRSGAGGGDHFAKPGANDRIWNSLEKHGLADPDNFAAYYGNEMLALISQAWLGPGYQVTAQVNRVNPGGAAQSPHRDYHLGFASGETIARYPLHVQLLSPALTLQGALAHVDMPVETGPTLLLPFSQQWDAGYVAMNRPDVQALFARRHVQLPLARGDMLFFSPALLHAAGANRTRDVLRMVNLFQVSSAFGRAMESVDRVRLAKAVYPALLAAKTAGRLGTAKIENAIAACADGYSFPTNLDRDPPLGGLAPKTQAALMREALEKLWPAEKFIAALDWQAASRLA
jgi:ectoine hydroxylase-related dioxygenase (phytanoyl-CoA dioxygenase family)